LNKILISNAIQATKVNNALLRRKTATTEPHDDKLDIFTLFLNTVVGKAVKNKNKIGDISYTINEKDLTTAMDLAGQKMQHWKSLYINGVTQACNTQQDQNKKNVFILEQKLKLIEFKSEMDNKSFARRVQSEVADKSYDLVFHVDMLQRQNDELQTKLENIHADVKDELREEYEDSVMKLAHELMMVKGKFAEYRQSLFKEMQKKFTEVKKDALIQIAQPHNITSSNISFKQKALKIVMEDNEANKLKKEAEEHKSFAQKLIVLNKLKLLSLRSKYEKRVREAEEERENSKRIYFGNKSKIEERENLLRQQLIKTQQLLSNMEMEVEQLRKDLQLQIKNKQKLVNWKVKNAQLLDELEVKVEKYERWNKVDVDKLLLELEKKKQELEAYTRTKTRENKKSDYVENKTKKTVEVLKKKLQKEKDLKSKVMQKMEEMHQEMEHGHESGTWQRKYFDAMADLQVASKEVEILKDHIDKAGMEEPVSPTNNNNAYQPDRTDTMSVSSFASSRPWSASTSERPQSSNSTRRLFKPAPVPHLNIGRQPAPSSTLATPTSTVPRDFTQVKRPSTVDPTATRDDFSMSRSQTSRSAVGLSSTTVFSNRPMTVVPGYQRVRSTTPTSLRSSGIQTGKILSQTLSGVIRPRSAGVNMRKRPSTANGIVQAGNLSGILGVIAPSSVKRPSTANNY
jgi:myosin heavy subunit